MKYFLLCLSLVFSSCFSEAPQNSSIPRFLETLKPENKKTQIPHSESITETKHNTKSQSQTSAPWVIESISPQSKDNSLDIFITLHGKNLKEMTELIIQCQDKNYIFPIQKYNELSLSAIIRAKSLPKAECFIGGAQKKKYYISSRLFQSLGYSDESLIIKNIIPQTITLKKHPMILLQGKGFDNIIAIQIYNNDMIDIDNTKIFSDTSLALEIPQNLPPGEYSLQFMLKDKIVHTPNNTFIITPEL